MTLFRIALVNGETVTFEHGDIDSAEQLANQAAAAGSISGTTLSSGGRTQDQLDAATRRAVSIFSHGIIMISEIRDLARRGRARSPSPPGERAVEAPTTPNEASGE
jgi:hypothetical protein